MAARGCRVLSHVVPCLLKFKVFVGLSVHAIYRHHCLILCRLGFEKFWVRLMAPLCKFVQVFLNITPPHCDVGANCAFPKSVPVPFSPATAHHWILKGVEFHTFLSSTYCCFCEPSGPESIRSTCRVVAGSEKSRTSVMWGLPI